LASGSWLTGNKALVEPDAVREFVSMVEAHRLPDMSFREDERLSPLPACADGSGLSHYLLLAAAVDAGVASIGIRPFLASLDELAVKAGVDEGVLGLDGSHERLIAAEIERQQRRKVLGSWQIKLQVPKIIASANQFVKTVAAGELTDGPLGSRRPPRSSNP
jgi:hypothetical protein